MVFATTNMRNTQKIVVSCCQGGTNEEQDRWGFYSRVGGRHSCV